MHLGGFIGKGDFDCRCLLCAAVAASASSLAVDSRASQNFLEADPYWDQSDIPVNTYKNKAPFTSKVISVKRIVGPQVRNSSQPKPVHADFFFVGRLDGAAGATARPSY